MIEEAILYCIMPNMWHSGKGKTMVTKESLAVAGLGEGIKERRDEHAEHRGFSGQ